MAQDRFAGPFADTLMYQPQQASKLVKRESPDFPSSLGPPPLAVFSDGQPLASAMDTYIALDTLPAPSAAPAFSISELFHSSGHDDDDVDGSDGMYDQTGLSTGMQVGEPSRPPARLDERSVRRRSSKGERRSALCDLLAEQRPQLAMHAGRPSASVSDLRKNCLAKTVRWSGRVSSLCQRT
jgi:hypothetical protein